MPTPSPNLLREPAWRDLRAGDVFRVPGVRGRRFRFLALVTNLDNGDRFVEAADVDDGRLRAFRPELELRRDAKASADRHARAAAQAPDPEAPRDAYEPLRLFD